MGTFRKYSIIFSLAFGSASIFAIPYIKFIFYNALSVGLDATNEQLGIMLTFYAIVHALLFIPGGWVADRYSAKWILMLSFIVTGSLSIWFAFSMSYSSSIIIWPLLGASTGFAYWAATVKAIRLVGNKNEQGKLYGFFESFVGLVTTLLSFGALAIYAKFDSSVSGLKAVIIFYSASNFVAATLVYFVYRENQANVEMGEKDKMNNKNSISVFKLPQIYFLAFIIFAAYGLYAGQTFLTPYLTDVLGITVTTSGVISIIRTNVMRFVGAPIGGLISDKIGSVSKVLIVSFLTTALLLSGFFFVSGNTHIVLVITLILLTAFVTFIAFGIMWAVAEEANIPRHVTGTAIGIASIIGYIPDTFLHVLFGNWLDQYGNAGYRNIFLFLIGLCILGSISSYLVRAVTTKAKASLEVSQERSI